MPKYTFVNGKVIKSDDVYTAITHREKDDDERPVLLILTQKRTHSITNMFEEYNNGKERKG